MSIEFIVLLKQATELYKKLKYFVIFNDIFLFFEIICIWYLKIRNEDYLYLNVMQNLFYTIFQDCRNSISSHFLLMFPEALIGLQINFYRGLWPLLPDDISLSCLQPNEKTYKIMLSLQ